MIECVIAADQEPLSMGKTWLTSAIMRINLDAHFHSLRKPCNLVQ